MTATALSVAGSDPSGGAGVQADLKTFSALGVYGTCVLTALTAQSTRGVTGVHAVPPGFVIEQLETLLDDVEVHAAKTGMIGSAGTVAAVVGVLRRRRVPHLVVDPVMVATSGHRLLDDDAVAAVRELLVPTADLLTPNLPEAAVLLGLDPVAGAASTPAEMADQGRALRDLGAGAVLVKGGHALLRPRDAASTGSAATEALDVLVDAAGVHPVASPAVVTRHTHGTGCTLSAALAALAAHQAPVDGWSGHVRAAKDHVTAGLLAGRDLAIGSGAGPVHHLHPWWPAGRAS